VYYLVLMPKYADNKQLRLRVADKQADNEKLRGFEKKLDDLKVESIRLQAQIEVQKKIVPADKDADEFIKLLHDTAATAGIEIRRYTAMGTAGKDYYIEVPFQIDIDGPYYSVVNFFDRIAKADRIVNISNLQMSNTKETSPAKVKATYTYAPGETVVASCTATTFFSLDQTATPAAALPKK